MTPEQSNCIEMLCKNIEGILGDPISENLDDLESTLRILSEKMNDVIDALSRIPNVSEAQLAWGMLTKILIRLLESINTTNLKLDSEREKMLIDFEIYWTQRREEVQMELDERFGNEIEIDAKKRKRKIDTSTKNEMGQ